MNVAVMVSGRGSNLRALVSAYDDGRLDPATSRIALVLSNVADAPALAFAESRGLPTQVIPHGRDRHAFEAAVDEALRTHAVDLVVLAGFMRLLSPGFVARWSGRIINVHPSLLPSFRGLHAQRQALEAGVTIAGCTVHHVDAGTDTGPILAQAAVPVLPNDTEETLSARILVEEHRLLPLVVGQLVQARHD